MLSPTSTFAKKKIVVTYMETAVLDGKGNTCDIVNYNDGSIGYFYYDADGNLIDYVIFQKLKH